jgi:hypothetical protein
MLSTAIPPEREMSSISDTMTRDHRACDERFAAAEGAAAGGDWTRAAAGLAAFRSVMERHFALEEETLFPAFERHTPLGDVIVENARGAIATLIAGIVRGRA